MPIWDPDFMERVRSAREMVDNNSHFNGSQGNNTESKLEYMGISKVNSLGKHYTLPMIDLGEHNKINELPSKCMGCGGNEGHAFAWDSKRSIEKGKIRIMCLDCLFDSMDKKVVAKLSVNDPFVISTTSDIDTNNNNEFQEDEEQGKDTLKKRKVEKESK